MDVKYSSTGSDVSFIFYRMQNISYFAYVREARSAIGKTESLPYIDAYIIVFLAQNRNLLSIIKLVILVENIICHISRVISNSTLVQQEKADIFSSHFFREGVEGGGCSPVTSKINRPYADLPRKNLRGI